MTKPVPTLVRVIKYFFMAVFVSAVGLPGCDSRGGNPLALTTSNFDETVLNTGKPVLVDFWADGCPPCKYMEPVIKELAADFAGKAVIGKVHYEDDPEIFEKYDVHVFPTFLVIKNGEVKRRIKGMVPKYYLSDLLGALQ